MIPETKHAENLWWLLESLRDGVVWIDLNDMPNPPSPYGQEWVFRHWAHDHIVKVLRPFFPNKLIYWAREEGLLLGVRDLI